MCLIETVLSRNAKQMSGRFSAAVGNICKRSRVSCDMAAGGLEPAWL